mmetsp:Transcript_10174/g.30589  ORF Transcript_10174/g.30589 Transcript_10174/m.30589 type:complete len:200 (+) Transcript_10174:1877-2476(+)
MSFWVTCCHPEPRSHLARVLFPDPGGPVSTSTRCRFLLRTAVALDKSDSSGASRDVVSSRCRFRASMPCCIVRDQRLLSFAGFTCSLSSVSRWWGSSTWTGHTGSSIAGCSAPEPGLPWAIASAAGPDAAVAASVASVAPAAGAVLLAAPGRAAAPAWCSVGAAVPPAGIGDRPPAVGPTVGAAATPAGRCSVASAACS